MSRNTPIGRISGVECPECGSIRTRCRSTGYTHDNDRVRRRACDDCGRWFMTVETVLPDDLTWGEMVPYSRAHDRTRHQVKFGYRRNPNLLRPVASLNIEIRVSRQAAKERAA